MRKSSDQRVLMLLQNLPYPRDPRVRHEARTLVSAGYHVSVIAPSARGQARRETVDGVDIYRFPCPLRAISSLGYLLEYGYSLIAIFVVSLFVFIRRGFDVIHAHQPPDSLAFIAAFYKLLGKRYVMDHHDLSPELYFARFRGNGNRFFFYVLVWLEKFSCLFADRVIATNQSYKQVEMRRGHVPERRIAIVRNGPDLNELHRAALYPHSRSNTKTIIGYVGVTGVQDGLDNLLRSLQHLVYDLGKKEFMCVVVGSGDALSSLKSLAQQLNIADKVLFTGWIDHQAEVARYLSTMDICVSPEPSDPYNDRSTAIKVMEYMALEKPIVAFDLPEHRNTAQDAAVYARPNDEFDFAKQIALLMDDQGRRKKMGQKGRERVEKEVAWQVQEKALLEVYESMTAKKRKRAKLEIGKWFALRGPDFVMKRATCLLTRYGIRSARARNRIEGCIASLAFYGCSPTFFVPGSLVKRYSKFIRNLHDTGVEIGVHSHHHLDLKAFPPTEASEQLVIAAQAFERSGIEFRGFRCPYLSFTHDLINALPKGLYAYSSNIAVEWELGLFVDKKNSKTIFETIKNFYQPRKAQDIVCTPCTDSEVVEIPVCLPDDLQLHDGLRLCPERIAEVWSQILDQTNKRGELFTLISHSELFEYCQAAFVALLRRARRLQPPVWISRLCDISDWWQEKSKFQSEISHISTGLRISFICSSRASILAKGIYKSGLKEWDGKYLLLNSLTLDVPNKPRPFVGIDPSVSKHVASFLQDQGYILDTSEEASQCAVYLDDATQGQLKTQVDLINWIEKSPGPLVRYWRWPDGAKSALSVTADLDALSLTDYVLRLFGR
jgi:glycosyltransferase involved in cell wall biosynthesis